MELALVFLAARDLARMRSFYRELLGWALEVDSPVYAELRAANGMRLGVYDEHAFARNLGRPPAAPAAPTRTELYLRCAELDDAVARCLDRPTCGGMIDCVAALAH